MQAAEFLALPAPAVAELPPDRLAELAAQFRRELHIANAANPFTKAAAREVMILSDAWCRAELAHAAVTGQDQ